MSKPKKRRRSRARPGALPKGAYRLPTGGYATKPISSIVGSGHHQRRIVVQGVRRDPPDLERLAKLVLAMAREEAEAKRRESL